MQRPKQINKRLAIRNNAIGNELRLNMTKKVMNHQPHYPKAVTYRDIDQAVFDWLNNLTIIHNGTKMPTYKLFSNQRMSEYGQSWQELDDNGNLRINFKTITREPNPQKGDIHGAVFNIPGKQEFILHKVPVLQEDGEEAIEIFSMKLPTSINLIYNVSIITDSFDIINQMNIMVNKEFNCLEKYIFPQDHAMPMILNSIGDESDYTIDDRKYYSQTYQIKVMAYIIEESDFSRRIVPSRLNVRFQSGWNRKKNNTITKPESMSQITNEIVKVSTSGECNDRVELDVIEKEDAFEELHNPITEKAIVTMKDMEGLQKCWQDTEDEFYVNKKVEININWGYCNQECEFEIGENLELESIVLKNIQTFQLFINGMEINLEDSDVVFEEGDVVKIHCRVDNEKEEGLMKLLCFNPFTKVENNGKDTESEVIDI